MRRGMPGRVHRPRSRFPGVARAAAVQARRARRRALTQEPALRPFLKPFFLAGLLATLTACAGLAAPAGGALPQPAPAVATVAEQTPPGAVIASAHFLATDAGRAVLAAGANAVAAAAGVSAALSAAEAIGCGVGGGGLFLMGLAAADRDGFIDGRETAPAAATPEVYLDADGELERDTATNGPWAA